MDDDQDDFEEQIDYRDTKAVRIKAPFSAVSLSFLGVSFSIANKNAPHVIASVSKAPVHSLAFLTSLNICDI